MGQAFHERQAGEPAPRHQKGGRGRFGAEQSHLQAVDDEGRQGGTSETNETQTEMAMVTTFLSTVFEM